MSRIIENPKQLILDTARQIMYKEGYEKLNIRNVASNCDISIGTIYNYYPTKKDLVIDLMTGYWDEYFSVLDSIFRSDIDTFDKLHSFYEKLASFIKQFREVWLLDKLYATPDLVKRGVQKEGIYMGLLFDRVEQLLKEDKNIVQSAIYKRLGARALSEFVVLNVITTIQMPAMTYDTFEAVLKELIRQ